MLNETIELPLEDGKTKTTHSLIKTKSMNVGTSLYLINVGRFNSEQ